MNDLPGVILAGGQSRRMGGGDKGLLDLNGTSILSRVIARLRPQVGRMAINANGDPARFRSLDLPVLPDAIEGYAGPLAGVHAAMEWAASLGAEAVITVAGDTPFFPLNLVQNLRETSGDALLALAATKEPGGKVWRQPTFGIWPVSLRADLEDALGQDVRKVVVWTDRHDAEIAEFTMGAYDPFFNINTAEDLALAREILTAEAR